MEAKLTDVIGYFPGKYFILVIYENIMIFLNEKEISKTRNIIQNDKLLKVFSTSVLPPQIKNKIRMPIISIYVQCCMGYTSQCSMGRKIKVNVKCLNTSIKRQRLLEWIFKM